MAAAVREVSDDTDEDEGVPSQREVALEGEVSSTWLGLGLGLGLGSGLGLGFGLGRGVQHRGRGGAVEQRFEHPDGLGLLLLQCAV